MRSPAKASVQPAIKESDRLLGHASIEGLAVTVFPPKASTAHELITSPNRMAFPYGSLTCISFIPQG